MFEHLYWYSGAIKRTPSNALKAIHGEANGQSEVPQDTRIGKLHK